VWYGLFFPVSSFAKFEMGGLSVEKGVKIKTEHILFDSKSVHPHLGEIIANGQSVVEVAAERALRWTRS